MTIHVSLSWPSKDLSPNARVHWSRKAGANKLSKQWAAWSVREVHKGKLPWVRAKVSMVFHPPDKRRRDLDNLIASMKGATDGISDAIGIDDSKFQLTYSMGSVEAGGSVTVTIMEGEK